jgi:hypothetical protein
MNPTTFAAIRTRLDRLERRRPKPARPTLFDALCGAAPPEQLPPEVLAMLEAVVSQTGHDRVEERIAAALRLPCGLQVLQPSSPGTVAASSVSCLAASRRRTGAGTLSEPCERGGRHR